MTCHLKGRQRCVFNFPWVTMLDDGIHVTVDADWTGDPKTRCSTSGCVFAVGPCFTVRHVSVTQATVSLSSAESEAKATTKGCIEALCVKHLLEHQTSRPFKIEVFDRQQQRQGHHPTTWTRAQGKTLGGADVMVSAAGKDRSHLFEQSGYAGESCRCFDKTRAASCAHQLRGNDGLHISWCRNCQVSNVHEHPSELLGSESCSSHETPCVRR